MLRELGLRFVVDDPLQHIAQPGYLNYNFAGYLNKLNDHIKEKKKGKKRKKGK